MPMTAPVYGEPPYRIVDAHIDLAYNALHGHDLRLPLAKLRDTAIGRQMSARGETLTVSLPALKEGNVAVAFGTLFVLPANAPGDLRGRGYTNAEEAHRRAFQQVEYYRLLEADGLIRPIGDLTDLHALMAAEEQHDPARPLGLVLLMEGADPIRTPAELGWWVEQGVRIVGPAWTATRYSGGTAAPGPLTALGRELLSELAAVGAALDVSHMADESFWQAIRGFHGPVIASHSNCRGLVPGDRQLSDDMIRAIADRDGVIGVVPFNRFLDPTWTPHHGKAALGLDVLVRHIEHICEVAGGVRHVGLGTDLDGGFGREAIPAELDSCVDLPLIGVALLAAGWRSEEVEAVLGGNWLRWLAQSLPRV